MTFDVLKTELRSINKSLHVTEGEAEDGSDEFFLYINIDDDYSLYVFRDDWGDGIGVHCRQTNCSTVYYASDVKTTESTWDMFVLAFLKSVYGGMKLFHLDSSAHARIDWTAYKTPSTCTGFALHSLAELNNEQNRGTMKNQ